MGHFHARHPAGLGQRAQERRNLQFRQLRHQLDQPLRRPYFEALHGLPEGAPHPPVEQRPRNPRPGIPRGRRSGCQLVVRQPYGNLRERIHQGLAARLAAQDRTDRGRGDRKGALRQRRRHPRIPQVAGHRPGHAVPAIQGRRSAGGKDQARQHGIHRGRRLQGRRPAQQFVVLHPADHRTAALQRQQPRSKQCHHHHQGRPHHRGDEGVRKARHPAPFRRTPLRPRRRKRHLARQYDGNLQEFHDGFRRHQHLRLDHRPGDAAGRHRRRKQHHARDGHGAHLRIRHTQGAGRQARVDHQADPYRVGDDNRRIRLPGYGIRRGDDGRGQLHAQPDAADGRRPCAVDLPQPDARSGRCGQRDGRAGHRRPDRRLRPSLPGRTTQTIDALRYNK